VERSDWSEDEPYAFHPPLPPDDRLWRHPSEMQAAGGPGRAGGSSGRRRVALAIAAGTAGALLVAAGADFALRADDAPSSAAATTLLLVPTTTLAALVTTPAAPRTTLAAVPTSVVATIAPPTSPAPGATSVPLTQAPPTPPPTTTVVFSPVTGLLRLVATTPEGMRASAAIAVDEQGTLVTSMAAVRDASSLTVVLPDGQAASAEVLGIDPSAGVAVLSVATTTSRAHLGRAGALEPGSTVATPWPSSATGTVRELGHRANAGSGQAMSQLLALSLPASSAVSEGEPLLDEGGSVVGLCTTDADGDTLAVPIELAHAAARSLRELGRLALPWMGISGMDGEDGPVVGEVQADSPAAAAGLVSGDIVTTVDGMAVTTMAALVLGVRDHLAGEQVRLGIRREGETVELSVTLAEKPVAVD
jgi:S1-C subfamily serine protease